LRRYSYDVFGEPNRVSGVGNSYMFTGRNYDSETGLYYYRARYYSPRIGRFLQPDPWGFVDGLNLYEYVRNNPVNFLDPLGLLGYSPFPGCPPIPMQPSCMGVAQEEYDREALNPDDFMRHCLVSCRIAERVDRVCAWAAGWWNEIRPGRSGRADMREDTRNNKIGRDCARDSNPCGKKKYKSCEECCKARRGS
jgi:RHS repeat-associated protein